MLQYNVKVGVHLPKKFCYLLHWKPFKNPEKWFLFRLKSSCRSEDVYVFAMNFWSCMKKGLIRKIRLTSQCKTSQPGYKQLQYTYCQTSHEVKATRQWNLVK